MNEGSRRRRHGAAVVLAMAVLLTLTSETIAASWVATKHMGPPADGGDLVRFGTNGAMLAWVQGGSDADCFPRPDRELLTSRSIDGGATWLPQMAVTPLGRPVRYPALASAGGRLDLVDVEGTPYVVTYRRSSDGGATWSAPLVLSGAVDRRAIPAIAHVGAQVSVTWRDLSSKIRVRTSLDNGGTFGPALSLGTGRSLSSVAIGSRTTYVVFRDDTGRLRLRRSFDGGATWRGTTPIAYLPPGSQFSVGVAAAGTTSIIVYETRGWQVMIRRSTNGGASYLPAVRVSGAQPGAPYQPTKFDLPKIDVAGGTWTMAYSDFNVLTGYVRMSANDGRTWSRPIQTPGVPATAATVNAHLLELDLQAGLDCNVRLGVFRR